jgi:hypothetical protein
MKDDGPEPSTLSTSRIWAGRMEMGRAPRELQKGPHAARACAIQLE